MSIGLNHLGTGGSILCWLGVILCGVSIALLIVVSGGISDGKFAGGGSFDGTSLTLHHTDILVIGWKDRLVFFLPLAAGVVLVISGMMIRGKAAEFEAVLKNADGYFKTDQSGAGDNDR